MGPSRGWESDVIFEREENLEDENGIWFEEGSTRFEFAFTLPDNMPSEDWHENAKMRHELYALVEGVPPTSQGRRLFQSLRASSPSPGPSRGRSPAPSRTQSPAASRGRSPLPSPSPSRPPSPPSGLMSDMHIGSLSVPLVHRSQHLPQTPSYEDAAGHGHEGQDWLEGKFTVKRNIRIVWNPNPTGGVNSLDEKISDRADELGDYEVHFKAPIWTVCCMLHTRIRLAHLPPTATTYCIRVELVQTVIVRSPRDAGAEGKAVRTSRRYLIRKEGRRPAKDDKRPDAGFPALWRGSIASGSDEGKFELFNKGRLPNDVDCRPSTMLGVETPVHVSQQLVVEVVYSVWGQDHLGQPLSRPGPGEQRTTSIARTVFLPGCPNIPENVGLPEYASDPAARLTQPNEPCPLCRIPPEDRYCSTCPFDPPLHPRHDHPPKLVGSPDGVCPVCSVLVKHEGDKRFQNCACALGDDEMEKLGDAMERSGGAVAVRRWAEEADEGIKDEYDHVDQRGRQRDR